MRKVIIFSFLWGLLGFSGATWAIPAYLASLCQNPHYSCIKIHKGDTWQTLFADDELRGIIMRFNRMNIQPGAGQFIVVPNNMADVKLMDLAPLARQIPATGQNTVIFDPALHAWGAYDENGQLVKWGPGSGGRDWCGDIGSKCHTVTGEFTVYRKGGAECASSKFPVPDGGAPMPYCMFFHGGYAIHASDEIPGYNASHGCVRIFLDDARWLNHEFVKLPEEGGTRIIIKDYPQSTNI